MQLWYSHDTVFKGDNNFRTTQKAGLSKEFTPMIENRIVKRVLGKMPRGRTNEGIKVGDKWELGISKAKISAIARSDYCIQHG